MNWWGTINDPIKLDCEDKIRQNVKFLIDRNDTRVSIFFNILQRANVENHGLTVLEIEGQFFNER
jgi:hypothetical protein